MALRARRISRQEYETRQRDRHMIVVDAAALIIGSLLLFTSVGAIVAVEPNVPPAEWNVAFSDEETIYKVCAIVNQKSPPCDHRPLGARGANEGETAESPVKVLPNRAAPTKGSVGGENATSFKIEVTWNDLIVQDGNNPPEAHPDQPGSWDTLELEVIPPPDSGLEPRVERAVGDKVNPKARWGSIQILYNVTERPADFNVTAMTHAEAVGKADVRPTTDGVGDWTIRVTVVDAGDISASVKAADQNVTTVPNDACEGMPTDGAPDAVKSQCDTQERQGTVEESAGFTGSFERGYEDTRQEWILDFVVVHWNARIS